MNTRKRKPFVGRDFKGDNRQGIYFTLSFKKEDEPVYQQLMRMKGNNIATSELVVDACRLKFGIADLDLMKTVILERYIDKDLVGPRLFKTFEDIMEWELKNTPIHDIVIKWGITPQQFSCLLYLFGMRTRELLKDRIIVN